MSLSDQGCLHQRDCERNNQQEEVVEDEGPTITESCGLTFSYSCAAGCGRGHVIRPEASENELGAMAQAEMRSMWKVGENWTGPMPTLWKKTERVWVW